MSSDLLIKYRPLAAGFKAILPRAYIYLEFLDMLKVSSQYNTIQLCTGGLPVNVIHCQRHSGSFQVVDGSDSSVIACTHNVDCLEDNKSQPVKLYQSFLFFKSVNTNTISNPTWL